MKRVIKIEKNGANGDLIETVNARELHSFLKVGRDYTNWIKGRIEKYGFVENQDYVLTFAKTGERQNVLATKSHIRAVCAPSP